MTLQHPALSGTDLNFRLPCADLFVNEHPLITLQGGWHLDKGVPFLSSRTSLFYLHSRDQSLQRIKHMLNFKLFVFCSNGYKCSLLKSFAEMGPKRQNNRDGRGILISQLEKICSSAFKKFPQNFSFYQNLKPFSFLQFFYPTFKGTLTKDLLIEAFYWVHLIAPYFRNSVEMEKSLF